MKKLYFLGIALLAGHGILPAQNTSYGGLIDPFTTAGTGGGASSFFGHEAGLNNGNEFNTFIGDHSGYSNTDGRDNSFLGAESGYLNEHGSWNVFVGFRSGYNNRLDDNVFVGAFSGENNVEGSQNTFIGKESGLANVNGTLNVFMGYRSGAANVDGYENVYVGASSGENNVDGRRNTFVGKESGFANNTGDLNVFMGYRSGVNNNASDNVFVGASSGENNTTGTHNTFAGRESGFANTTGVYNTFIGSRSGFNNTTGYENNGLGYLTLFANTTGARNTANGIYGLYSNVTGNENTAIGYAALGFNTVGNANTANGTQALLGNTSGFCNVAVGHQALALNTTGSHNTAIGCEAGPDAGNYSNTTALGNGATTTASNQVRIGNASVTSIGGIVGWTAVSDARFKKDIKEDVTGLSFIRQLRPVSYELDRQKLHHFLQGKGEQPMGISKGERTVGFIAQEVDKVVQERGYVFSGVDKPQNETAPYGLRYAEFVVPLVKGMQEQQELIEQLQQVVAVQQQQNETLRQEVEALKMAVYGTSKTLGTNAETMLNAGNTGLSQGFALYQNTPNPFHKTTTIRARVPQGVQQASILIYNLQGMELANYPLVERGEISLEISAGRFSSGMYLYTLLADGQTLDTKKMILTH